MKPQTFSSTKLTKSETFALPSRTRGRQPAQLALVDRTDSGSGSVLRDAAQARRVEQQAAVAQAIPAEQLAGAHAAPPGRRTSIETGKTWAAPDMAWRLGSRYLRMRSRSRSSWARTSS